MISSIITFLTSLLLLKVTDRVHAFLTVHFFCLLWNLFFRFLIIQFSKTLSRSPIFVRWVALLAYHIRFSLSRPFFIPAKLPLRFPLSESSDIIPLWKHLVKSLITFFKFFHPLAPARANFYRIPSFLFPVKMFLHFLQNIFSCELKK